MSNSFNKFLFLFLFSEDKTDVEGSRCPFYICECDRKFAHCLSMYSYNPDNRKTNITEQELSLCGYYG